MGTLVSPRQQSLRTKRLISQASARMWTHLEATAVASNAPFDPSCFAAIFNMGDVAPSTNGEATFQKSDSKGMGEAPRQGAGTAETSGLSSASMRAAAKLTKRSRKATQVMEKDGARHQRTIEQEMAKVLGGAGSSEPSSTLIPP